MSWRDVVRRGLVWLRLICQPDLLGQYVPTHPKPAELTAGQLLIVGQPDLQKWACLRCPGGCGEQLLLSLNPARRPRWTASIDWLGRPTVQPSVKQLDGCRCHFWIRCGMVEWCSDSGRGGGDGTTHPVSRVAPQAMAPTPPEREVDNSPDARSVHAHCYAHACLCRGRQPYCCLRCRATSRALPSHVQSTFKH